MTKNTASSLVVLKKQKKKKFIRFSKKKLGAEVDEITLEFRRIELLYSTPPYRALSAGARHDSICSTNTNLTGALPARTEFRKWNLISAKIPRLKTVKLYVQSRVILVAYGTVTLGLEEAARWEKTVLLVGRDVVSNIHGNSVN